MEDKRTSNKTSIKILKDSTLEDINQALEQKKDDIGRSWYLMGEPWRNRREVYKIMPYQMKSKSKYIKY